jgi:hypothetical protein
MIDWEYIAIKSGMSAEEIFDSASSIAAIYIDSNDNGTSMSFTCSDDIGPLVMVIKRQTH